MTPRHDDLIPPLLTVSTAAARLRCSRAWVHHLVADGRLTGVRVGRLTLLAESQVDALANQRQHGAPGWRLRQAAPTIPALVSPDQAATIVGYAQGNWVRTLYHRGEIPGQRVGPDIVFRRQAIAARALLRALTEPDQTASDVR